MELTEDECYEIEKILDIYSGMLSDRIAHYCNIMLSLDGAKALKGEKDIMAENPLDKSIRELTDSRDYVQKLRQRLQSARQRSIF